MGRDGSTSGWAGIGKWAERAARECQKQFPSPAAQPQLRFLAAHSASFQSGRSMRTADRSCLGSDAIHSLKCSAVQNS
eukprot:4738914-Amphidinium_carterae.1